MKMCFILKLVTRFKDEYISLHDVSERVALSKASIHNKPMVCVCVIIEAYEGIHDLAIE